MAIQSRFCALLTGRKHRASEFFGDKAVSTINHLDSYHGAPDVGRSDSDAVISLSSSSGGLIARAATEFLVVQPRTVTVPDDYPSIMLAVMHAGVGDRILVRQGAYQEHLIITKPLSLSALGGKVTISSIDSTIPVVLVDVSQHDDAWVSLSGMTFVGKKGVLTQSQTGIEIISGHCRLADCAFVDWYQMHPDYVGTLDDDEADAYFSDYQGGTAVTARGRWSSLEIMGSAFDGADSGIDASDGARVVIRMCAFAGCQSGVCIFQSADAHLESNTFSVSGLNVGRDVRLFSEYDTLIDSECLVDTAASSGTSLAFNHLTFRGQTLVGLAVGDGLVHPGENGEWLWEAPTITLAESIICVREEYPSVRYAASAFNIDMDRLPKPWEAVNVWRAVQLRGRNLLCSPGIPGSKDPRFGPVCDGKLTLLDDSPARRAASDGSNLGAWQGD